MTEVEGDNNIINENFAFMWLLFYLLVSTYFWLLITVSHISKSAFLLLNGEMSMSMFMAK